MPSANCSPLGYTRNMRKSKPLASAWPTAAARACPSSAHSTRMPSPCSSGLLGEALTAQSSPDAEVDVPSGDGLLRIRMQPLAADSRASIHTATGTFSGRDHLITITRTDAAP